MVVERVGLDRVKDRLAGLKRKKEIKPTQDTREDIEKRIIDKEIEDAEKVKKKRKIEPKPNE